MVGKSPGEERRRERERVMVQEGLDLLKRKKEDEWFKKLKEQREEDYSFCSPYQTDRQLKEMLNKYSPWGKPGCGAPNPDCIRKKKLQMEGLYPEKEKNMSAVHLGRQGGGAPRRTDSGQLKAQLREDPMLRFQNNEQVRRCVNNVLRYRTGPSEQKNYKQQLVQAELCPRPSHRSGRTMSKTDSQFSQNCVQQRLTVQAELFRRRAKHRCISEAGDAASLKFIQMGKVVRDLSLE
ncbi:hypothetical protein PR048_016603 [Dryococelus australis]|uniref:Uncharacterized protein n=1 Tax=Dryococelus australis TaxID=614101 RepID=A0ABQ9H771_9NEOP|nr:hypothetical protein PR048_016603 [Dryococelus australis]